jgi:hypothetical protein
MTRIHTEIQSSKVIKGYMYFYHMLAILISMKSIFFQLWFDPTDTVIKCLNG